MAVFPRSFYASRLDFVKKALARKRLDAFLVTDMTNIRYLTGFSGSSASLLIAKQTDHFVTDFRYREQAARDVEGWDVVIEKGERIKTIARLCRKNGIARLGFECTAPYALYRQLSRLGIRLTACDSLIEKFRSIKTAIEIETIRRAVERAETAFLEVKPYIRPGIREIVIARRLEDHLRRKGCQTIPFPTIVASGPNAALPHAKPSDRTLRRGDLVIIDWGGESDGYCSDMTRTLLMRGDETGKQREIYEIVLMANKKAIAAVVPGVTSKQIDGAARSCIREAGYGQMFGHGTGHGVGLQVHELPRISWNTSVRIRKGMVFTIEPGIYLPGVGGVRIEDMVLVGETRAEVLTSLNKELA